MQNEIQSLNQDEQGAWRTFLRAHANVTSALSRKLTDAHGLNLSDFEVLSFLSEAPSHALRMTELAYGVLLSPSGLTRRLDGLVRQGYVERSPAPSDGRGLLAVLTQRGAEKVREMTPTHAQALHQYFIDLFQPDQLTTVAGALEPIAKDGTSLGS